MHHVEEKLLKYIRHVYSDSPVCQVYSPVSASICRRTTFKACSFVGSSKQADDRNLSLIFSIDFLPPFFTPFIFSLSPPSILRFIFSPIFCLLVCLFFSIRRSVLWSSLFGHWFVHIFLFFILFFFFLPLPFHFL